MNHLLTSISLALVMAAQAATAQTLNVQPDTQKLTLGADRISTFDGAPFTAKRAREILEAEGYDYLDHYGCAALQSCAGPGRNFATVVGIHPTHGTVIHNIAALPCIKGSLRDELPKPLARQQREGLAELNVAEMPLREATADERCFGGYRVIRRGIVDWGFISGGDAWSLRQSILFEWLGPKGWRKGKTLSAVEWQAGLLSRSDGWTEGAAYEVRGPKGRVRAENRWEGLTIPGSDGSGMSNLERCEVRKNTILARETFKDQVREEECRSSSFMHYLFGGDVELSTGIGVKAKLPGGCETFDRTSAYIEMIAQDEFDRCVANPDGYFAQSAAVRTPNAIDLMIESDLLDPETVEWIQSMSIVANCIGEETSEREVEVVIDGKTIECTETTTTFYFKGENGSCESQSSSTLDCGEFEVIK